MRIRDAPTPTLPLAGDLVRFGEGLTNSSDSARSKETTPATEGKNVAWEPS